MHSRFIVLAMLVSVPVAMTATSPQASIRSDVSSRMPSTARAEALQSWLRRAAVSASFPDYSPLAAVYVVRVGQYGSAVTDDSLRSNNSVLVMTDTAFAVRFVQFWEDHFTPRNP